MNIMKRQTSQYLRLGILVLAGLVFFMVSVYLIGKQQNMFKPVIKITTRFSDVKGLQLGNNVRFSGIDVGTVSGIELIDNKTVRVEMAIDKKLKKFIRKNSMVEISNDGLMGNNILIIHSGSEEEASVEEGDELLSKTSITTDELLTEAKSILQNSKLITNNLIEISTKMNNGNGDFSKLLNENNLSSGIDSISNRLMKLSSDMEQITWKINHGNGDIGKLLNEDDLTRKTSAILNKIDSVSILGLKTVENLHDASLQIKEGNGVVQKLIYDTLTSQKLDTTLLKINGSLDEAKKAVKTVERSWILNIFSKKKKKSEKIIR